MNDNAVNHLLLALYKNFKWGDPYEIFDHGNNNPDKSAASNIRSERDDMENLVSIGLIPDRYYTSPEIVYSERDCSIDFYNSEMWPKNLFDVLGEYIVKERSQQGLIFIYEKCVEDFGIMVYRDLGKKYIKSEKYCIDMVRDIVLWHELGHWITHWMKGSDGHRWNNTASYVYNEETKDLHEALAQIFAYYAMFNIYDSEKRNVYFRIFYFMLNNQGTCYQKFNKILMHPKFSWEGVLMAIVLLRIEPDYKDVQLDNFIKNMSYSVRSAY